ncbi:MAG: hypothetical protein BWX45_01200 [Deltaproteobacteria bacterium ADurb.Bin002]|nr:MAG: hypothetical protein BWX45_01200 [Deltaproteobacteria bacterium ADurb.Bin002]
MNLFQKLVVAGFDADIRFGQAGGPQHPQFVRRFCQRALRPDITADMPQGRKSRIKCLENLQQGFRFDGNGVAVAQEHLFHVAVVIFGHADVVQDLPQAPHAVFLVFVHAAEGALIMGATNGALKQVTRGLAEGPEYISFVSQSILPGGAAKANAPRRRSSPRSSSCPADPR